MLSFVYWILPTSRGLCNKPRERISKQLAAFCVSPRSLGCMEGCPPLSEPSSHCILSACLSICPSGLEGPWPQRRPSCSPLYSQHLVDKWEVPNKHLLNEYILEIVIYITLAMGQKCRISIQCTLFTIIIACVLCLVGDDSEPGMLRVILLMAKQP